MDGGGGAYRSGDGAVMEPMLLATNNLHFSGSSFQVLFFTLPFTFYFTQRVIFIAL